MDQPLLPVENSLDQAKELIELCEQLLKQYNSYVLYTEPKYSDEKAGGLTDAQTLREHQWILAFRPPPGYTDLIIQKQDDIDRDPRQLRYAILLSDPDLQQVSWLYLRKLNESSTTEPMQIVLVAENQKSITDPETAQPKIDALLNIVKGAQPLEKANINATEVTPQTLQTAPSKDADRTSIVTYYKNLTVFSQIPALLQWVGNRIQLLEIDGATGQAGAMAFDAEVSELSHIRSDLAQLKLVVGGKDYALDFDTARTAMAQSATLSTLLPGNSPRVDKGADLAWWIANLRSHGQTVKVSNPTKLFLIGFGVLMALIVIFFVTAAFLSSG